MAAENLARANRIRIQRPRRTLTNRSRRALRNRGIQADRVHESIRAGNWKWERTGKSCGVIDRSKCEGRQCRQVWPHGMNKEWSGIDGYDQRNASYNTSAVLQITSIASCAA